MKRQSAAEVALRRQIRKLEGDIAFLDEEAGWTFDLVAYLRLTTKIETLRNFKTSLELEVDRMEQARHAASERAKRAAE